MTDQLLSLVRSLTISQRIGIVFGAVLSVLLMVGLVMWAGQPQMQTAFTGLSTADASTITDALTSGGIPYELADGGKTIKVPSSQISEAKIAAGNAGYQGENADAFSIFDSQGFGTSEFDQNVTYQRAIEGKLTTTIEQMEGVADATVSVVQAQTGVLSAGDAPATASVVVKMASGQHPSDALVAGIVSTVAGAVSGLTAQNVTVVDADGTVLAGPDGAPGNALAMQGRVEAMLAGKVQALVDKALGPGNASVAVSADLNLDQVEKDITTYAPITPDNYTPSSVQQSEELYGADANAAGTGGIPGSYSNVVGLPTYPNASPSASPNPSASPAGGYVKRDTTVNFASSATVAHVIATPGAINRLSVSVLLNSDALKDVTAETLLPAIKAAVGAVATTERTDEVQVIPVKFAAADTTTLDAGPSMVDTILAALPQIGGGLLAFVLLFLVWRNMRALRGRAEEYQLAVARAHAPQLGAGDEFIPDAYASGPSLLGDAHLEEELVPTSPQAKVQERIRLMAEDKPDELANLVTTWLREDEKNPRRR